MIYTPHTLELLKELGLDTHKAIKLALQLHTHSVQHEKKRNGKSTPAKRPRALRKGSLTNKLERVLPKGPQA
eukprot:1161146-Pelagomonas_calceolata.AAC.7